MNPTKKASAEQRRFIYHIDSRDFITFVNQEWIDFAIENDARHLTIPPAPYQSLWDFITNKETVHIYRILLKRVREEQRAFRFPFRCDSPDKKRLMEMEIWPLGEGKVQFKCLLKKEETRLLPIDTGERKWAELRMVTLCSWCKRAKITEGERIELEFAIRKYGLFLRADVPPITHGICPSCYDEMMSLSLTDQ